MCVNITLILLPLTAWSTLQAILSLALSWNRKTRSGKHWKDHWGWLDNYSGTHKGIQYPHLLSRGNRCHRESGDVHSRCTSWTHFPYPPWKELVAIHRSLDEKLYVIRSYKAKDLTKSIFLICLIPFHLHPSDIFGLSQWGQRLLYNLVQYLSLLEQIFKDFLARTWKCVAYTSTIPINLLLWFNQTFQSYFKSLLSFSGNQILFNFALEPSQQDLWKYKRSLGLLRPSPSCRSKPKTSLHSLMNSPRRNSLESLAPIDQNLPKTLKDLTKMIFNFTHLLRRDMSLQNTASRLCLLKIQCNKDSITHQTKQV